MTVDIENVKTVIEFILLPVLGWMIQRIDALAKAQTATDIKLGEIRVALIGLDGKNGMRSQLDDLKRVEGHRREREDNDVHDTRRMDR